VLKADLQLPLAQTDEQVYQLSGTRLIGDPTKGLDVPQEIAKRNEEARPGKAREEQIRLDAMTGLVSVQGTNPHPVSPTTRPT
jgi:hypothetical protein